MNQKKQNVSMSVVRRLPRYYRFLTELSKEGVTRVSSKELSQKMGFTASQIRQDFNCFGGFGQQGYGYNVFQLCEEIEKILGIQQHHPCILIGAGNLGKAIARHMSFEQLGFQLIGVFDNAKQVIGGKINGHEILDYALLEEFYKDHRPLMAILCVPQENMEQISDKLYALGIRSFWNFSHYDITLKHPDAIVENVHMNDSLMTLSYKLRLQEQQEDDE